MRGKRRTTLIISITLLLILVLPVMNLTASNSDDYVIPSPQKTPIYDKVAGFPEGWSDDINISNNETIDEYPALAIDGNNLHIVWKQVYFGDVSLYYRNSTDAGLTWNDRVCLVPITPMIPNCPDIAVNNSNVHIMYFMWETSSWELNYINSTDGGITWNPSKRITADDGYNSEWPQVAVNNSNVHIVWVDSRHKAESMPWNTEIYYMRSKDGGITWDDGLGNTGQDRRLTTALYSSAPGGLAINGSYIHLIMIDDRTGDFEVYYKRSVDNGVTWDDGLGNIDQDRKLTTNTTNHHHPIIAVNGSKIYVAWFDEEWPGPEYHIYYVKSSDSGATWSNPTLLLNSNTSSTADIVGYDDTVEILFYDWRAGEEGVYLINSTDGGTSWNPEVKVAPDDCPRGADIYVDNNIKHLIRVKGNPGVEEIIYKRYPDFPPDPTYNINLNEGWNLISTPLIPRDESIDKVLENITGKWDYIQYYNATNPDHWKTNATFKPDQLNDLKLLNHKMAFWINITEPNVVLTVSGQIPTSTTIPLYAGWNLVGYPSLDTETVGNALFGTTADRVEVCDVSEPYNIREVGPEYVMKPGEGYWIHVVADSTWVVDW